MNNLHSLYSQNPYSYLLTEEGEYKPIDSLKNARNAPAAKDVIRGIDKQLSGEKNIPDVEVPASVNDITTLIKLTNEYKKQKTRVAKLMSKLDLASQITGKNIQEVTAAREALQILLNKPKGANPHEYEEVENKMRGALQAAFSKSEIPNEQAEMLSRLSSSVDAAINVLKGIIKRLVDAPEIGKVASMLPEKTRQRLSLDQKTIQAAASIQSALKSDEALRSIQNKTARRIAGDSNARRRERLNAIPDPELKHKPAEETNEINNIKTEEEAIAYAKQRYVLHNIDLNEFFEDFIESVYNLLKNHKFGAATQMWAEELGDDMLGFSQSQVITQNGKFINRNAITNPKAKIFMLCMLWAANKNSERRKANFRSERNRLVKKTGLPILNIGKWTPFTNPELQSLEKPTNENVSVFTFLDFINENSDDKTPPMEMSEAQYSIYKSATNALMANDHPDRRETLTKIQDFVKNPQSKHYIDMLKKIVSTLSTSDNEQSGQAAMNLYHALEMKRDPSKIDKPPAIAKTMINMYDFISSQTLSPENENILNKLINIVANSDKPTAVQRAISQYYMFATNIRREDARQRHEQFMAAAEPIINNDNQDAIFGYLQDQWYHPDADERYSTPSDYTVKQGELTPREYKFLSGLGEVRAFGSSAIVTISGKDYPVRLTPNHGWFFIEGTPNGTIAISLEKTPPETEGGSTGNFKNKESYSGPLVVSEPKVSQLNSAMDTINIIMLPNATIIPNGFADRLNNLNAVIAPNVEEIGAAFVDCKNLWSVEIDRKKLKLISKNAFKGCPVKFPTTKKKQIQPF